MTSFGIRPLVWYVAITIWSEVHSYNSIHMNFDFFRPSCVERLINASCGEINASWHRCHGVLMMASRCHVASDLVIIDLGDALVQNSAVALLETTIFDRHLNHCTNNSKNILQFHSHYKKRIRAPSQYKDRLSTYGDSHVKDKTVAIRLYIESVPMSIKLCIYPPLYSNCVSVFPEQYTRIINHIYHSRIF